MSLTSIPLREEPSGVKRSLDDVSRKLASSIRDTSDLVNGGGYPTGDLSKSIVSLDLGGTYGNGLVINKTTEDGSYPSSVYIDEVDLSKSVKKSDLSEEDGSKTTPPPPPPTYKKAYSNRSGSNKGSNGKGGRGRNGNGTTSERGRGGRGGRFQVQERANYQGRGQSQNRYNGVNSNIKPDTSKNKTAKYYMMEEDELVDQSDSKSGLSSRAQIELRMQKIRQMISENNYKKEQEAKRMVIAKSTLESMKDEHIREVKEAKQSGSTNEELIVMRRKNKASRRTQKRKMKRANESLVSLQLRNKRLVQLMESMRDLLKGM